MRLGLLSRLPLTQSLSPGLTFLQSSVLNLLLRVLPTEGAISQLARTQLPILLKSIDDQKLLSILTEAETELRNLRESYLSNSSE